MFFNKFNFKVSKNIPKWLFSIATFGLLICLNFAPLHSEEKTNADLPPAPDTGTPEEDFQSAGTRDNRILSKFCDADSQKIVYLLGNDIRESTISPYPFFWFYFSDTSKTIDRVKFVLKESDTEKEIYRLTIESLKQSGTVGIPLPREKKYALIPNTNYSWNLTVNCVGEGQKTLELRGWLRRLLPDTELQSQLAAASEEEKYRVYLEHNILYDALNDLARRRTQKPGNTSVIIAWNQLLNDLGWYNLSEQSPNIFYVLQTDVESE